MGQKAKNIDFFLSFEFCYGYTVLTFAVNTKTEGLNKFIFLQFLLNSGTQRTGSFTVNNADR